MVANLIRYEVPEAIQHKDAENLGRQIVTPPFVAIRIIFRGQLI